MVSNKVKLVLFYVLGPFGCYLLYQFLFVFRHLKTQSYPQLSYIYDSKGYFIEIVMIGIALYMSYRISKKYSTQQIFTPSFKNLSLVSLLVLTLTTVILICSSIYRVLGTLDFSFLIENFDTYYFQNTMGLAWMILLCYIIIYTILIDMYFGGVTQRNALFLFINILVVSVSGGRGLLILFNITFLALLISQKVSWRTLVYATVASLVVLGSSYLTVTALRAPSPQSEANKKLGIVNGRNLNPTENYEDLNYNAAFIIDDVLSRLKKEEFVPGGYAFKDALTVLVPRFIFPDKPISSAETIEIYPAVAARGTNITFPLKANLIMHLGRWGFYLDWVVVVMAQVVFLLSIYGRSTNAKFIGFMFVFLGCAFSLIARGGIFNARLIVQVICIGIAYGLYLIFQRTMKRYSV